VVSGDPSTIASVGVSPQNRPLTYSYSSDQGQISGTGTSVTLATAGVPAGTVKVTCNAVDDFGQQATANTTVEVTAPPAPAQPLPQPQPLCSLSFERDHKRPDRVDNESKACLDDIALALQRDATSKLVIVGNHAAGETADDSAQRGLNVRQYLVDEKGIDQVRIEVRAGDSGTRTVENVLLPQGASYTGSATVIDPGSVKRRGQAYGKPHPHK
jgi:outer membrane protein OmpA-like peptidoglycan-associated protein